MQQLGERIRKKREDRQLQLNDLAKKLGISSSALSQIENGKAFPTIINLKSIADCLYTTVGELMGEHETLTNNPLSKDSDKKLVHVNANGAMSYLISHHDPQKQMDAYLIVLPEGSDTDGVLSTKPGQVFFYLVEGSLEVLLDSKKYVLKQGDSFYLNSKVPHTVTNINDGITRLIWVRTPPGA
jgi:transcriptional regulator with XRE-family HTH domain